MTIPAGFGLASVVHTGGGIENEAIWTIGFDNNASDTAADCASTIHTLLVAASYSGVLSSSVTVAGVHVKLGPDATGPSAFHTSDYPGLIGGHVSPPNIAALVHKITSLGGRQGRGRIYVPGVAEASLETGGALTSEYHDDLQAMFTNLGAGLVLSNLPPMLLHADAVSPTAIDALTVDARFATQRRRLRR